MGRPSSASPAQCPSLSALLAAPVHLQQVDGLLVHAVAGVDVGGGDGGLAVLLQDGLQGGAARQEGVQEGAVLRARSGGGRDACPGRLWAGAGGAHPTFIKLTHRPPTPRTPTLASWRRIFTSLSRLSRTPTAALQRLRRAASSGTRPCRLCSALRNLLTSSTPAERAAGGGPNA
jgi:hypothetical protein